MSEYYIGLLSGTSLDAIDAALVEFKTHRCVLIETLSYPIPDSIKQALFTVTETGHCTLETFGHLNQTVGQLFADAADKLIVQSNVDRRPIRAVGCHGITLYHHPEGPFPFSLQIGDPNVIAHRTQLPTVINFRMKDMILAGQGAPLAPALHAALFRSAQADRVIVNIGGIANLSVLPADHNAPIQGFDTGPGNSLLDAWTQRYFKQPYDHRGEIARTGQCQVPLLQHLQRDPFFQKNPPKSTGREYFNLAWLEAHRQSHTPDFKSYAPEDIMCTLSHLTANTIATAIQKACQSPEVYLCGGGHHNTFLCDLLTTKLACPIHTTDVLGLAPDWVEAVLFAWLAKQRITAQTTPLRMFTGAQADGVLGGVYVP